MTEYDTALIDLAGIGPAVWGEFPLGHTWNGWLCPHLDPLAVMQVLDFLNEDIDGLEGDVFGFDFDWREDGALILTERQFALEEGDAYVPEVLQPNEDGLYSLGAYAWVWSVVGWNPDARRGE